jgi:molybdenum cofactor cytidylyltransferase
LTRSFLTLSEALGIRPGAIVAVVGGGGKTSTVFRLCREASLDGRRALATTTARMKTEELAGLREVLLWDERDATGQSWSVWTHGRPGPSEPWIDEALSGTFRRDGDAVPVTFLGRSVMRDKLIGLPADYLGELLSRLTWDVVVVEADGSRGRSIKGHRLGEPVIPLCATHCVIVLGADGFSEPVNDETCHRPEVIQDLLGLTWGERLSPRGVVDLVCHPRGVLAKIPGDMEVVVYVNKAPMGGEHRAAEVAAELLARCGRRVQRVAVGDNHQGGLVEAHLFESAPPEE